VLINIWDIPEIPPNEFTVVIKERSLRLGKVVNEEISRMWGLGYDMISTKDEKTGDITIKCKKDELGTRAIVGKGKAA